jgi:hypothetical protein
MCPYFLNLSGKGLAVVWQYLDVSDLEGTGANEKWENLLFPTPQALRKNSLRQHPLFHNVVEGGKDTLSHMALQWWIEVRNDLEGKKWRE